MASGYEKSPEYGGREPKSREVLIGLVIAGLVVVLFVLASL